MAAAQASRTGTRTSISSSVSSPVRRSVSAGPVQVADGLAAEPLPASASQRASAALAAGTSAESEVGAQSLNASAISEAVWMDDVMSVLERKTEELASMHKLLEEAHQREADVRAQAQAAGAELPPAQEASTSSTSTPKRVSIGSSGGLEAGPEYLDKETERLLLQVEGRSTVSAIVLHLRSRMKALAHKEYGASWHKLFKGQDLDGSGFLGWDEFLAMCHKLLGKDTKQSHVRILYRSMDYDRSGDVSMEEMVAFMEDPVERMRVRLRTAVHQKYADNPRKLFKGADRDASGGLEWEEFRRFVRTDLKLVEDDVQLTVVFRALDADGSGIVCLEEFATFVADEDQLINVPLRVTLVSGRGLVNSMAAQGLTNGNRKRIDPYCICEIPGRQSSADPLIKTKALNSRNDPEWKHVAEIPSYNMGESLVFSVWHRNHMSKDVLLGRAKLAASLFVESGFDGEIQMFETGSRIKSYVRVKVEKSSGLRGSFVIRTGEPSLMDDSNPQSSPEEATFHDGNRPPRAEAGASRQVDAARTARIEMDNVNLRKDLEKIRVAMSKPGGGIADETVREQFAKMVEELKELKELSKKLSAAEQGLALATQERKTLEKIAKETIKQKVREAKEESSRPLIALKAELAEANRRAATLVQALEENNVPMPEGLGAFSNDFSRPSVPKLNLDLALLGAEARPDAEVESLHGEVARLQLVIDGLKATGGGTPRTPAAGYDEGHDFCHEKEEALLGASSRAFNEATAAKTQVAELEVEVATLRKKQTPRDAPWLRFTPAKLNIQRCFARTWNNGLGGQCAKRKLHGSDYCDEHRSEDSRAELGTVDGPIPEKKLLQFQKLASRNDSLT